MQISMDTGETSALQDIPSVHPLSPPPLSTFDVLLPPTHVHACCDAFAYTHTYRTAKRPCGWRASTITRQ